MKNLSHSEWRLSVMALAALIGTYIAIFVVLCELSTAFVIGSLIVFVLVVVVNAIYVFKKRKKSSGRETKMTTTDSATLKPFRLNIKNSSPSEK